MFLRCLAFSRKDGSQRKYLQIVQTYRESGRVRQKIVANLGRLDELIASGTLEKLSDALSRYVEKKELLCKAEELMATSALSFGPVPIFTSLWKKLGLPEAIATATKRETATYDPAPVIFRMVLGRLLDPSSKLSTHRWAETIWWDDGAVVELQHYYRSLGILARSIKKIEEHLYYRERDLFTPAPDLLFFDTTSTYFTGAGPMTKMACHGFSKDNHPENKQVMVGVVMTREGTPLAHHVFPGNTPDAAAFSEVIEELSTRFGIKRVIVVGDRGMFNAKVIARIEELKLEYIAGVKMRQDWDVKEIVLENKAPFETVADNLKVKLVELGEERYIVCLNEEEAKRDQAVREEIVSELREKIAKGPRKMIGNTGYRRVPVRRQGCRADRREKDRLGEKVRRDLRPADQHGSVRQGCRTCLQGVVAGGAGVPGDQDHLRDPAGVPVPGRSDQGTHRRLLPGVLSSGGVPSDRTSGGEAERAVGPLHAAGTLRGPDGSSESRGGGIPDPDRAVPRGQRHLPGRRGTRSASRQHRSLTENNSWKCSVTPKNRQNRG